MWRRTIPRLLLTTDRRRKWEQRIAAVMAEKKESDVDTAARRFQRIYQERRFTPVGEVFPHAKANAAPSPTGSGAEPLTSSSGILQDDAAVVTTQPKNSRFLQVSFLGPQNSGKSALVNALSHAHVSVESKRSGSTNSVVQSVATVHDTQLLFTDTPGIVQVHHGHKDRRRNAEAALQSWESLFSAQVVVLAHSVGLGFVEPQHRSVAKEVLRRAAQRELPVVLALTKMDKVQTPRQKELYFALRTELETIGIAHQVAACFETSVKDSKGLVELKDFLCRYAVPGPWKFYRHEVTALAANDRVHEIIRQVCLDHLPHEIPHCMRHRIVGWTQKENASLEIVVEVFVSRPSYLFVFYSKLEALSSAAQLLALQELKKKTHFVFQGFITPGEVSSNSR